MRKRVSVVALLIVAVVLAGCSSTGETTTNTLSLDYPDADPVQVALDIREGELTLRRGGTDNLNATVTTNVRQWQASAESAGDTVRITQGSAGRTEVINNAVNQWDVALGDNAPLALTVSYGAANATLNLGGLPLTAASITGTSGSLTLDYETPVGSADGGTLSASLGNGGITARSLLNSHARTIDLTTSGGDVTLEFSGDTLVQDLRARVDARIGSIVIRVPEGLPVRLTFDSTSGVLRQIPTGFIDVGDNAFETAEYANADQPRVLIEVTTVTGTLQLEIVADL